MLHILRPWRPVQYTQDLQYADVVCQIDIDKEDLLHLDANYDPNCQPCLTFPILHDCLTL